MHKSLYVLAVALICLNTVLVAGVETSKIGNNDTFQLLSNPGTGNPPAIRDPYPEDNEEDIPANGFQLQIYIEDVEDHVFDWTITTSPDIGSAGQNADTDGVKTCTLDYLKINCQKTYKWTVWASDGTSENSKTYTFTTEEYIPTMANITVKVPFNGPTEVEIRNVYETIYNWTGLSHKVKIEWQVINEWQSSYTENVRIRMGEWQQTAAFKLFQFWYTTGMVRIYYPVTDPNHEDPLGSFEIIKLTLSNQSSKPPIYESGVDYLDMELAWEQFIEIGIVAIHFRGKLVPNARWGGLSIDPREA